MKKFEKILLIIGLILIIIPYFINIYTIFKLISLLLGIIIIAIVLIINKKINIFLALYLPILLLIFTYAIDYLKVAFLDLSPIYVLENKTNEQVSTYNSLFYRIIKCNKKYIFDDKYNISFPCDTSLIANIDINKLLNEPKEQYHKYHHDFIKVTGKISKINGNSSIEMQAYIATDKTINGYVEFNNTSKLKIMLKNINTNNYKIYDYVTFVGFLSGYKENSNELILTNTKLEENNLYDDYDLQVIESSNCNNEIKLYQDNLYTYCIDNVFINYKVDKYELSYVLKDKKIELQDLLKNSNYIEEENYKIYNLEKFKILECSPNKSILINNKEKVDYSLCE